MFGLFIAGTVLMSLSLLAVSIGNYPKVTKALSIISCAYIASLLLWGALHS